MENRLKQNTLCLPTQLAYGVGDLGPSMAGNILMIFFFFFLTTVAGLPPSLAGLILLLSNGWSAISTLFIGVLSDRTQSRWGRRRVWMFWSAPVLAITFLLLWWVPPSEQWIRFTYYLIVALLFQTAGNAFTIPYGALVTELTDNHDDHIRLNSARFSFSLGGCIASLLLAQGLTYWVPQPQQQLLDLGLFCSLVTIASIIWCCWGTEERANQATPPININLRDFLDLLRNQPLRFLVGIYALAWLAVQITPAILPYFIVNCLELDSSHISKLMLVIQGTALASLFLWEQVSRQVGKKLVYWAGVTFWVLAQLALFQVNSNSIALVYGLAIVIGFGMATAYLVPISMLPEVVDLDELETGHRREGLVYSILVFLQKVTLALGLFGVGQFLSWSGFQEAVPGPIQLVQADSALLAIRLMTVALPVFALLGSLVLTYFYPITQEIYQDTAVQLQQRRVAAYNAGFE
ncbi:MFS transporter [Oculatella sp. LEGE 06141]|uniref:MFS transporter n=1 Tax=Oculatella sp. LEGE 06141 TaxID=1828648 RepID=UPI0018818995|nr:MFS transporter [Oculatella sp. LEGE 06141]MBE9179085.1 MFS transporter [Oculatella sp. LEGE 06141]